ncbi:MAG: dihydrolipoyl dehydrogenase [Candidatus Saganbacteria bacterium]|nr:dihydrolipoyl dehydrogenase [Candidatus Saganbacteria bacterium]
MADFDIIVIGAGPGGYTAAIRASQLGAKVALIEKDRIGGTCLNRGCIPTKALLYCLELFSKLKTADKLGIEAQEIKLNWEKVQAYKEKTVEKLVKGIDFVIKQNKIEIIQGTARIIEPEVVEVTSQNGEIKRISAHNIIIATGSEAATVPPFVIDHQNILDSTDALNLKSLPQSMLVIGGGVMGIEFASLFKDAGVDITVIEMMPSLLPAEDEETSKLIAYLFKKRGIEVLPGSKVKEANLKNGQVEVLLEDGTSITKEKALLTIGRSFNNEGLAEVGIKLDKGMVATNRKMQTNLPGIYAVGDITGVKMVAHVAMAQGKIAAECAMGQDKEIDYKAIPMAIHSSPEIASVGITEKEAIKKFGKENIKIGKFPFQASGKAQAISQTEGFIKIISNQKDQILGIHIVGPHAADLIAEGTLAYNLGVKLGDIEETIHAHPTLAEAFVEAVEAVNKKSIHIVNK